MVGITPPGGIRHTSGRVKDPVDGSVRDDGGVDSPTFWSSFPHDPRDPSYAALRASDQERSVVHQALAEAYAEGRLDADELEARSTQVAAARTLGELPPLVADLLPAVVARRPRADLARATSTEVQQRAERAWRKDLREAVGLLLVSSIVCWVVWAMTIAPDGHPWPVWVMLGTGINLLQTALRRSDIIDDHRRRLEKKQAREQRRKELGP